MTLYLLDTNIISDLVRLPQGKVAAGIARGERNVATSIVVAAELRYGCDKRGSRRLMQAVEAILRELPVLALERPVASTYGAIRVALEEAGTPIGGNALLIAAHALSLGAVLVTANVSEFTRVIGLTVENWLD